VCMCVHMSMCSCHGTHVKVRGQPWSVVTSHLKQSLCCFLLFVFWARVMAQWAKGLLSQPEYLSSSPQILIKSSELSEGVYNSSETMNRREETGEF